MRVIDPSPFISAFGEPESPYLGEQPGLSWLPIASLRIDPNYQREVLRNGKTNILAIARKFDWSLFGVVVVANIGNQLFAIVDGQHRTIAAAIRGITDVPCIIIHADEKKQAQAFAAINGAVTAITPLSIFAAQVAGGVADAVALRDACTAAGVTVCRYPVPSNNIKVGQTLAIGALRTCSKTYGLDHLSLALKVIMRSRDPGPGLLRAPVIRAVCHVLDAEPAWARMPSRLFSAISSFDLLDALNTIETGPRSKKIQLHRSLAIRLFDYLDEELGS